MVKKEGVTIAAGYGLLEFLQSFGNDGGAISPALLTELTKYVNLPTIFILGAVLWFFRSDNKEETCQDKFECPFVHAPEREPQGK